jgi:hypothetical protein
VAQALSVDAVHPLFEQAVAGDEAAFEALIGPLVEPALRLAQSMLGDRWEAEDATQEAITRAWRKLGQLRPGMPLRPWFLAIVVNQCRNVRRTRGAAGLAAILIAAIAIATFAYVRAGYRPSPEGPPRPVQSPTPSSKVLDVPNSTPVILYGDPAKPDQVDGMTWDGKLSGIVPVAPGTDSGNPAATLFATSSEIRDRSGQLVATGNYGAKFFRGAWADDEQQFCQMAPFDHLGAGGVPATLQIVTPGQAPRSIVQVGRIYEQVVTRVAACSVLADRAVVVQSYGGGGEAQYWVVRLSTGKILWTHKFAALHSPAAVVASRDGMYVAENVSSGKLPITGAGSTIYGPDGKEVGHLADWVEAFSWDGSLAVTDQGWVPGKVGLVNWRNGTVVWSAPAGYALQRSAAQPEGTSVAIWILTAGQLSTGGPFQADLYVIAADGQLVSLVRGTP